MQNTIKLLSRDGRLYFPHGGGGFDAKPEAPKLLMVIYGAGDCDIVSWPLRSDKMRKRLAAALYDERECNQWFPVDATIELPDGEIFDFDAIVD